MKWFALPVGALALVAVASSTQAAPTVKLAGSEAAPTGSSLVEQVRWGRGGWGYHRGGGYRRGPAFIIGGGCRHWWNGRWHRYCL